MAFALLPAVALLVAFALLIAFTRLTVFFFFTNSSLQASGDEQLHDFVGSGVDAQHSRVAIKPRYRIFVHVAVAAKQLQAAIDDFAEEIGKPVFRHRSGDSVEFASDVAFDAMIEKDLGDR